MECREAFFAIQRHYDGELTTEEQRMLDQHLLGCAECRQEFDEYGDFFGDISCLTLQVEHRDVLTPALERIEEASRKRRLDIWWRAGAVAASFAVITSTAFFSLTETGSAVGSQVALIFQDAAEAPVSLSEQQESVTASTWVEDDPQAAGQAIQSIRQSVPFPLLEVQDKRLTLISTRMLHDKKMVELAYKMQEDEGVNADVIYFLATVDHELIKQSKYNLGVYQYNGSVQAGNFLWSMVGEHAMTAEINHVVYQLYSPFLSTTELRDFASSLKRVDR